MGQALALQGVPLWDVRGGSRFSVAVLGATGRHGFPDAYGLRGFMAPGFHGTSS